MQLNAIIPESVTAAYSITPFSYVFILGHPAAVWSSNNRMHGIKIKVLIE
jgi:hypothetical protein